MQAQGEPIVDSSGTKICFTLPECKELIRWNEESKNMKSIAAWQYKKIQLLEEKVVNLEAQKSLVVTVRDTLIKEVETADKIHAIVRDENEILRDTAVELGWKIRSRNRIILGLGILNGALLYALLR